MRFASVHLSCKTLFNDLQIKSRIAVKPAIMGKPNIFLEASGTIESLEESLGKIKQKISDEHVTYFNVNWRHVLAGEISAICLILHAGENLYLVSKAI